MKPRVFGQLEGQFEVPDAPPQGPRVLGHMGGQIWIADDFNDPLPWEIQRYFEGEDDEKPRTFSSTHVLIWSIDTPQRLTPTVRAALLDQTNETYVSTVVPWEIAIKLSLGKLTARPNVASWLPEELRIAHFESLPITLAHGAAVEHLPFHHRDPFDRLLIAQAVVEGLTIVTNDQQFGRYQVQLLPCW